tara:strand:+ start:250 stop:774 length:525 start_codon:yes stop_codon:yes gene_type:complete
MYNQTFHETSDFNRLVVAPVGFDSEENYKKELEQELNGDTMQWSTPKNPTDGTKSAGLPKPGDIFSFYFPKREATGIYPPREGHINLHQIVSVGEKPKRDWWKTEDGGDGSVLELSQPIASYPRSLWVNEMKGPDRIQSGCVYNLKGNPKWSSIKRHIIRDFKQDDFITVIETP